jgi:hypothetical protein
MNNQTHGHDNTAAAQHIAIVDIKDSMMRELNPTHTRRMSK